MAGSRPGPNFSGIIAQYKQALATSASNHGALLDPKGRQPQRFAALTQPIARDGFSLLDYGCGLADLKASLDGRFENFDYQGVDIVEDFVDRSAERFPQCRFRTVDGMGAADRDYDFIVAAGVFHLLAFENPAAHKAFVRETLAALFARCRVALCVDFMRADVDFVQTGAYHQDLAEATAMAAALTRRFVLDQSYLPYEYALILYKDDAAQHPSSTFRPL